MNSFDNLDLLYLLRDKYFYCYNEIVKQDQCKKIYGVAKGNGCPRFCLFHLCKESNYVFTFVSIFLLLLFFFFKNKIMF